MKYITYITQQKNIPFFLLACIPLLVYGTIHAHTYGYVAALNGITEALHVTHAHLQSRIVSGEITSEEAETLWRVELEEIGVINDEYINGKIERLEEKIEAISVFDTRYGNNLRERLESIKQEYNGTITAQ